MLPTRTWGSTGISLPVLALGTAPSGHRSEQDAVAFYHRCLDAGIAHVDTGPTAGGFGIAQACLRPVLAERRREVFVATRVCEPDGEKALAQLARNLAELGIEQADLVYVQSLGDDAMAPERIYSPRGVCRALEHARSQGLTRWLGVSGHHRPARFLRALAEWDFDVMLNAVNLVSRHIYGFEERVWPAAAAKGVALLAMKVFGGVRDSRSSAKGASLPDHLKPDSLRYALSRPGACGVVVGLHDQDELERTLAWVRSFTPLSRQERDALEPETRALALEWREPYGPAA